MVSLMSERCPRCGKSGGHTVCDRLEAEWTTLARWNMKERRWDMTAATDESGAPAKTWTAHFTCGNCFHDWDEEIQRGHVVKSIISAWEHGVYVVDEGSNYYSDRVRTVKCPNCETSDDVRKVRPPEVGSVIIPNAPKLK